MTEHDYKATVAAFRNAADLAAEVERLTAENKRLRAGQKLMADACDCGGPDPEAPPIPCVEVDATDGRRTWRAMGEDAGDSTRLGPEWETCPLGGDAGWGPVVEEWTDPWVVYLVRRSAPRTVAVELPEDVAKRFADPTADLRLTATDEAAVVNACRAALTEAGDR